MMNYLLCEDSTGGFQFWKTVNKELLNGFFCEVESAGGRGNLPAKVEEFAKRPNRGLIFVAIDNIPKSAGIIRDIESLTAKHGLDTIISDYWCIEEVFVSFYELAAWTKVSGPIEKEWRKVQSCVIANRDYLKEYPEVEENVRAITGGRRVNREMFYARLLGKMVDNGLGQFSLTKTFKDTPDVNASCWFNDCCDAYKNLSCRNVCGVPSDMTVAQQRLEYLFIYSLLANRTFVKRLAEISSAEFFGSNHIKP